MASSLRRNPFIGCATIELQSADSFAKLFSKYFNSERVKLCRQALNIGSIIKLKFNSAVGTQLTRECLVPTALLKISSYSSTDI
jgi:hypothetical protein